MRKDFGKSDSSSNPYARSEKLGPSLSIYIILVFPGVASIFISGGIIGTILLILIIIGFFLEGAYGYNFSAWLFIGIMIFTVVHRFL